MLLTEIVSAINKLIANNSSMPLTYKKLEFYIESAVDNINLFLNTEMLNPKEDWEVNQITYNIIYSDKYLGEFNFSKEDFEKDDWFTKNDILKSAKRTDLFYNASDNKYYMNALEPSTPESWVAIENDVILSFPKLNLQNAKNYDYTCLPENVIRQVLIYYVAALYLEEEDEFEAQYKTFINRAESSLEKIRKIHYSSYDVNW